MQLKVFVVSLIFLIPACATLPFLSGCKGKGPAVESCILDGEGNGHCTLPDETQVIKPPGELENYFATSGDDLEKLLLWCNQK